MFCFLSKYVHERIAYKPCMFTDVLIKSALYCNFVFEFIPVWNPKSVHFPIHRKYLSYLSMLILIYIQKYYLKNWCFVGNSGHCTQQQGRLCQQ